MTRLRIVGVAALVVMMAAPDLMAQRRGGGAARSGMRGAMVGGLVGGSSGARKGAKAGVVVGATRSAVNRASDRRAYYAESEARTQYQSSAEYQSMPQSNFDEETPQVITTSESSSSTLQAKEAVIRRDGKPVLAITYPADWKKKSGDHFVTATSADGQAWSVLATLSDVKDKLAGIEKIRNGLSKNLQDVKFDKLFESKRGAFVVTGTGKGKKQGIDVVFAGGVFETGEDELGGLIFIVDASIADHYKEAIRQACQSVRLEKALAKDE